jgi:hypothetical protein
MSCQTKGRELLARHGLIHIRKTHAPDAVSEIG